MNPPYLFSMAEPAAEAHPAVGAGLEVEPAAEAELAAVAEAVAEPAEPVELAGAAAERERQPASIRSITTALTISRDSSFRRFPPASPTISN